MSKFVCCFAGFHRGFQMKFENGWTISVQFGEGNYCSGQQQDHRGGVADTAECAVITPKGNFWRLAEYDDVKGHMTTDEVGQLIQQVMGFERA